MWDSGKVGLGKRKLNVACSLVDAILSLESCGKGVDLPVTSVVCLRYELHQDPFHLFDSSKLSAPD